MTEKAIQVSLCFNYENSSEHTINASSRKELERKIEELLDELTYHISQDIIDLGSECFQISYNDEFSEEEEEENFLENED